MQFILVERGDRRQFNLLFYSESLDRMFAKVPIEFLDESYMYALIPAGYISANDNFTNQAAVNTIIQERTPLYIVKQDWRKYITANRSEATHYLYHTNNYFRKNKHILRLTDDEKLKAEFRVFEFGTLEEKKQLVGKWQAEELIRNSSKASLDCISTTAFGRLVLYYLNEQVKEEAKNMQDSDEVAIFSNNPPSKNG